MSPDLRNPLYYMDSLGGEIWTGGFDNDIQAPHIQYHLCLGTNLFEGGAECTACVRDISGKGKPCDLCFAVWSNIS